MTEIYKIVNGIPPPIMNSLFEFRNYFEILEILKHSQLASEEM